MREDAHVRALMRWGQAYRWGRNLAGQLEGVDAKATDAAIAVGIGYPQPEALCALSFARARCSHCAGGAILLGRSEPLRL